ncbi:Uncharacterised protein [Vibrio cholerae]|nr:Uncharacterised protein [Vibrio cholerae]
MNDEVATRCRSSTPALISASTTSRVSPKRKTASCGSMRANSRAACRYAKFN